MSFMDKLQARWDEGFFVCVGLDSDKKKLPKHLLTNWETATEEWIANDQFIFNKSIIDATKDIVCAFKPNLAFYRGAYGKLALKRTIAYIHEVAPGVVVILDAKQADIGNTNDGYVEEDFDWYGADGITVHPYLGREALQPFLDRADKGIIVLCRTSNPGAGEFQDLPIWEDVEFHHGTHPLYEHVAWNVSHNWNGNGNCAVVVGATYPEELSKVRGIVGDMPILIPGLGTQGGEIEPTVKAGQTRDGKGMINNLSRAVIFASSGKDFADAARRVVLDVNTETDKFRNQP